MNIIQTGMIIFLFIILCANKSLAVNFNPGNYEVTNWMEIPGTGRVNEEKHVECITEKDLRLEGYKESGCKLLSENVSGNTLRFEFKCNFSGVDGISSDVTYFGDSFKGTLIYKNDNGSTLKVGISGKRIGDCSSVK